MFQELHLTNFKNFREATLELGPFTVLVGANASGKSNLRDAFRFLHGVGRGYDFVEILEEKYGEGGERVWSGLRGGINGITYRQKNWLSCNLKLQIETQEGVEETSYDLKANLGLTTDVGDPEAIGPHVSWEKLSTRRRGSLFDTKAIDTEHSLLEEFNPERIYARIESDGVRSQSAFDISSPVLSQLKESSDVPPAVSEISGATLRKFRTMRFLELEPRELREAAPLGQKVLGDRGQNLAPVLRRICHKDNQKKKSLVSWVEKLTPMDAKDITFTVAKHSNEVTLLLIEKDGTKTPMQSASDGTLRFLGLLALLFQDDPPELLFIEEIETGLHPTRLDLLANLIEQRTEQTDTQVIATTHSPLLLQVLDQETLEDAQLVYRTGDGPEARITPLLQVPTARKVLDKPRQSIRDLHSTGWFERVMAFGGEEAVGP